jgi:hypothetical protein
MPAFPDFFLRQELEYALYSEFPEQNAIRGGIAFACEIPSPRLTATVSSA